MGILDNFTDFLLLLGVIFPPVAGVMLVDYYVLRTSRRVLDVTRKMQQLPKEAPLIGWNAIIESIAGATVGLMIDWGVPSFNSLMTASVAYWVICSALSYRVGVWVKKIQPKLWLYKNPQRLLEIVDPSLLSLPADCQYLISFLYERLRKNIL